VSLEAGQLVGNRYRIERLIGRGSASAVYEGSDVQANRRIAIKVLDPVLERDPSNGSLGREAHGASSLGNEHILQVLDSWLLPSGARCMVTELLTGETLEARLERVGKLSETELGALLIQLLDGLGAAHRAGIVHRELKPARVFIAHDPAKQCESVKILGFGTAKSLAMAETGTARVGRLSGDLSRHYLYLSPEQVLGREADRRSNVYSVGVIAYRSLTGKVPLFADDLPAFLAKLRAEESCPLARLTDELDGELAEIIDLAMARAPEARFQTAQAMTAAIMNWAESAGLSLSESSPAARKPPAPVESIEHPRPKEGSGADIPKPQAKQSVSKLPPPIPVGPAPNQPPPPLPPGMVSSERPLVPRTRTPGLDTRGPMVIAPAHNPGKLRLGEEPEALVVIQDGKDPNASPNSAEPHTLDSGRASPTTSSKILGLNARLTRSRRAWLMVALLLGLLGAGTVVAKLGMAPAQPSSLDRPLRDGHGAGLVSKARVAASISSATSTEKSTEEYADEGDNETAGAEASSAAVSVLPAPDVDEALSSTSRGERPSKKKPSSKASRKATTGRNPYDYR
jgi:serine/threonine protein kinase